LSSPVPDQCPHLRRRRPLRPGCSVFTCGDGICECYFPYNPVYDEAEPESACCCERDCGISCSGNGSTTYPATTTMPLPPVPTPTATPVNSSCYMTSSIYKEPCCVDYTLPQGYCYTGSVCQDGMCVDQQAACYMTLRYMVSRVVSTQAFPPVTVIRAAHVRVGCASRRLINEKNY